MACPTTWNPDTWALKFTIKVEGLINTKFYAFGLSQTYDWVEKEIFWEYVNFHYCPMLTLP